MKVTQVVLCQKQQARGWCCCIFARHLHPNVCSNQRLNAFATCSFVELDGTKQVAQVTDGECGLLVSRCSGCDFVNADRAVDD